MKNPFDGMTINADAILLETDGEQQQKIAKRNVIYQEYDPMVNEILDMFIAAHRQGVWEKDSDCSRRYCCHIAWFAGPKEKYADPYDKHHKIRRQLEVRLDLDGLCNPTGFTVTQYSAVDKIIRVGLRQDDLVRGIKEVIG